jgi:glycosyltransferase involved in cell wall biosynthesis
MSSDPHRRFRVLQVITHLALGGAERVAFNLMHGLAGQFDFAVYAANGVDAGEVGQSMQRELAEMSVPLHLGTNVPIKFGGMILAGWWMKKTVREFKPDIIHLHTEIPESSYASMVSLAPSLARIPLVRTIHNTIYWNPWRKLGRWCDAKMARSYVACVSIGAADAFNELRAESGAGALPEPPAIILNGVRVTAPPRAIDKPPGDPIRMLFAGRFEDQKGADLLPGIVRAVKPPPGKRIELTIHGGGTHEAALRELASNPPAGWSIQLHGPVANLSARLPTFDLLLMPSRYEGLALLAIEAARLNVPVVATDGPGVREGFPADYPWLAKAGDAGSYTNLLQRAIDDPSMWPDAARCAEQFARKYFDVSVMCSAYATMYRDALR